MIYCCRSRYFCGILCCILGCGTVFEVSTCQLAEQPTRVPRNATAAAAGPSTSAPATAVPLPHDIEARLRLLEQQQTVMHATLPRTIDMLQILLEQQDSHSDPTSH